MGKQVKRPQASGTAASLVHRAAPAAPAAPTLAVLTDRAASTSCSSCPLGQQHPERHGDLWVHKGRTQQQEQKRNPPLNPKSQRHLPCPQLGHGDVAENGMNSPTAAESRALQAQGGLAAGA